MENVVLITSFTARTVSVETPRNLVIERLHCSLPRPRVSASSNRDFYFNIVAVFFYFGQPKSSIYANIGNCKQSGLFTKIINKIVNVFLRNHKKIFQELYK